MTPRGMQRQQQGFVLVLTMWVLVTVAIAATYFAERVQKSLQLAVQRQDVNEAQIALSDARAEMLFRLATTQMTMSGLGSPPTAVRLDDREYSLGATRLQLQDVRGLLNLNQFADEQMLRFMATLGIAADRRAGLIDTLRDYVDEDDLQRLNGAESPQYRSLGLTGLPRNAPLVSPIELRTIIGWRDMPELWRDSQLLRLITADKGGAINPNTAPWQVLTALPNVTEDVAKMIIERRQLEPVSVAWLDNQLGTQLSGIVSLAVSFPADSVRLTQWAKGLPWGLSYTVSLTPKGSDSPWKIGYFYRSEKESSPGSASNSPGLPNASDSPSLPPRSAQAASAPFLFSN